MDRAQPREEQLHHERRAERVREAGVLGTRERDRRHAELAHPPQALHLGGVEEPLDDALLVALERDQTVDGIPEDHGTSTVSTPPSSYQTRTAIGPAAAVDERHAGRRRGRGRRARAPSASAVRKGRERIVRHVDRPGERIDAARRARREGARASAARPRTLRRTRRGIPPRRRREAARSCSTTNDAFARSRRARAVPRASGDASPTTKRRPSACALSPVVPLPPKTSTTRPPLRASAGDDAVEQGPRLLRRETPCALPVARAGAAARRSRERRPGARGNASRRRSSRGSTSRTRARSPSGARAPPPRGARSTRRCSRPRGAVVNGRPSASQRTAAGSMGSSRVGGASFACAPSVHDERVERAAELVARGLATEVGRAPPDDLVDERVASHDLVEDHPDEVRRAPVDVNPQRAGRRQQRGERLEPRREHVEIAADALAAPTGRRRRSRGRRARRRDRRGAPRGRTTPATRTADRRTRGRPSRAAPRRRATRRRRARRRGPGARSGPHRPQALRSERLRSGRFGWRANRPATRCDPGGGLSALRGSQTRPGHSRRRRPDRADACAARGRPRPEVRGCPERIASARARMRALGQRPCHRGGRPAGWRHDLNLPHPPFGSWHFWS